ncbi:hypothetical protein JAAARDRAFT_38078 [Jaapia argillacea MUCL 33604]|uniref:Disintegrin and metalloproteinase domain-containing protein B n=1 Tax=Jaapia argillacea MUCL 33604 TaxID=933084 RepID=A0A067PJA4_9AGAM|nr:hypothetical protein JAAARDRAFT_38078 [Jaapia argillacea MUCL 33604]
MLSFHFRALVVVLIVSLDLVSATSAPARPLKRIAHPSTLALEILPRRAIPVAQYSRSIPIEPTTLLHTDSFRLTISAFGQTYHLHLRPNEHLIHPDARINYYQTGSNGQAVLARTEPLLAESVKAYWGEVVAASHSSLRMREDAAGVVSRAKSPSVLGWARIMVHYQGDVMKGIAPIFEGAFSVGGVVHHITTKENYFRNKHELDPDVLPPLDDTDAALVVWRDSDVMTSLEEHVIQNGVPMEGAAYAPSPRTCGHDSLSYNTDPLQNPTLRRPLTTAWYDRFGLWETTILANGSRVKRDDIAGSGMPTNFVNNIGQTDACPKTQKVVYMGVAADCAYTDNYGSTSNATQQILTNWNAASAHYKSSFNVSLGIIELQVHDGTCPATADPVTPWNVGCGNVTLNDRLSLFSDWRGKKGNDGAGLWHLMSGCPTGTEVGIAWLGTLCQQSSSGSPGAVVSGTAVSTAGRTEWQVVTHETGHNFGAIHDCVSGCNSTTSCCPLSTNTCDSASQFIMSPTAEVTESQFSQCTLGNICSLMKGNTGWQTNTTCVVTPNPSQKTISLQMCGNGIVEAGEDCDPGQGVNSTCCNSATCKFLPGAVCDPESSPCCTSTCGFAPATQVCRPAKDADCDIPEMCTGNNATCPPDITDPNGKTCGPNGLACASGLCTSVSQQCQTAGASMGLQQACSSPNDKSCQVSCQDPTQSDQCIVLQSSLIDGSPCGYGGTCSAGSCHPGSLLDTIDAWYKQNLQISIPVTVVSGIVIILVLAALIIFIRRCVKRRKARASSTEPALQNQPVQRLTSWEEPRPPMKAIVTERPHISIPAALQPGSSASRQRAPSVTHHRSRSLASRDRRSPPSHDRRSPSNRSPPNRSPQSRSPTGRSPPNSSSPRLPRPIGAAATGRTRSITSPTGSGSRQFGRGQSPPLPRANWVDETQWNGSQRR